MKVPSSLLKFSNCSWTTCGGEMCWPNRNKLFPSDSLLWQPFHCQHDVSRNLQHVLILTRFEAKLWGSVQFKMWLRKINQSHQVIPKIFFYVIDCSSYIKDRFTAGFFGDIHYLSYKKISQTKCYKQSDTMCKFRFHCSFRWCPPFCSLCCPLRPLLLIGGKVSTANQDPSKEWF